MNQAMLQVTYLELCDSPRPPPRLREEPVQRRRLDVAAYLALYRRIGGPWRWDQRLELPRDELVARLERGSIRTYVLDDAVGDAIGLCEFEGPREQAVELTNFGLVPERLGQGLGPWLLQQALAAEWEAGATRIWLHTDTWDHPAAVRTYQQTGFLVYDVQVRPATGL